MVAALRIKESELVLPALYIMADKGVVRTSELIIRLATILKPTGKDAEIITGRRDTHFSQKVRNLVCHRKLGKLGYATYTPSGRDGLNAITEEGRKILVQNMPAIKYLLENDFEYEVLNDGFAEVVTVAKANKPVLIFDENIVVNEGAQKLRNTKVYERSKVLRDYALQYYSKGDHISCSACSFDFYSFYGELGKGFIEIHHRKPVFQYGDLDGAVFLKNAVENVAPVCSNCHRMIHRKWSEPVSIDYLRYAIKGAATLGRR